MIFRLFVAHVCLCVPFAFFVENTHAKQLDGFDLIAIEKHRVLGKANNYLSEEPRKQSRFHTVKEVLVVGTIITQRVIIGGLIQRILKVHSFDEMVRRTLNFFWIIDLQ